ncbi:hypothetical protein HPB49_018072 [Dermacentor silvarum]|uniref:Uncharacterized protein n=1 Tax=Dermacentor silvarum TaxID=543639 RepID=A0ACB8E204_DERSI|nr:hypothetical protein HPB49_018072 [Dermacentor silvarum]
MLAVYLTLGNLPSFLRTVVDSQQLVLLCREADFKHFVCSKVFERLISDLQDLEEGIMVDGCHYIGQLAFICGDNLGSHSIGGFVETFSRASYICQFCITTMQDFKDDKPAELSTVSSYTEAATYAKENEADFMGVKHDSSFTKLSVFHVCLPGLPPCLGHNLFEGVRLDGKLSNILRDVVLLLTSFLHSNTRNDAVLEWSLKITQAETSFGDKDVASVGLIPLVVSYFKDDLGQLVQVHELVLLCREADFKHFVCSKVFERLISDLQDLEEGIMVDGCHYIGQLAFICGDNLGSHSIGGFVETFSRASYICQFCITTMQDFKDDKPAELSTVSSYTEAATYAKENEADFMGVKHDSSFTKLSVFHVCLPGLPPCLGHNLFEGVVEYDLALIIKHFVKTLNLFNYHHLNMTK